MGDKAAIEMQWAALALAVHITKLAPPLHTCRSEFPADIAKHSPAERLRKKCGASNRELDGGRG
jgi:hypothetical protein